MLYCVSRSTSTATTSPAPIPKDSITSLGKAKTTLFPDRNSFLSVAPPVCLQCAYGFIVSSRYDAVPLVQNGPRVGLGNGPYPKQLSQSRIISQ